MVNATGLINHIESSAISSLADCPAWQSLCGAVDADAAAERIYQQRMAPPENQRHYDVTSELAHLRPYAFVYVYQRGGLEMFPVAEGTAATRGAVLIQIVRDIPEIYEDDPQAADVDWSGKLGSIIEELFARSRLFNPRFKPVDYGRGEIEDAPGKGEYQLGIIEFQWGLED